MKILLTGATGFVGSELLQILPDRGIKIIPTGHSKTDNFKNIKKLDLTDFAKTNQYIKSISPNVVLHLAGNKDVLKCEADKAFSRKINFEASENLISLCFENKIKLIYISTDYIFEGVSGHYNEFSVPKPTTQYGKDKLAVENLIKNKLTDFTIVRTAGIFGMRNDFVDLVWTKLKHKEKFHAYVNLKNSPTYIKDFAIMLVAIIKNDHQGTFHCAGSESLSRYDFALKIAEHFIFDKSLIVPEELNHSKDPRPADLTMDCARTYKILDYYPKNILEILKSNYKSKRNEVLNS